MSSKTNRDKNKLLIENNWIVVGSDDCKYTKSSIKLLQSKNMEFIYLSISIEKENEMNIKFFEKKLKPLAMKFDPTHNSYPYIYDKGIFVGGNKNLLKYLDGLNIRKLKLEQIKHYTSVPFEKFIKDDPDEDEDEDETEEDYKFKSRIENFLKNRIV